MQLDPQDLATLLEVSRDLSRPLDLHTMLAHATQAARRVMRAERASVWLHDAATAELVLEVASDIGAVRIPVGRGLVGACALARQTVTVPDCYADPRFDASIDRRSGYVTRCLMSVPMLGHDGELVGVLQVLNRYEGAFGDDDEPLAAALAAQCAVAIVRTRLAEAALLGERLRHEMALAREVQCAGIPATAPAVDGYAMAFAFRPASLAGGDSYDAVPVGRPDQLLLLLADAAGHGMGAALQVTQMQALLRMALRLGASLEEAARQVNDQMAESAIDGRFVTAYIALLDAGTHRLRHISAGQAPILLHRAATCRCEVGRGTTFPLGAMPHRQPPRASDTRLEPGDMLVLLSDGFYETEDAKGEAFGRVRVEQQVDTLAPLGPQAVLDGLLRDVDAFRGTAEQDDDMTAVIVQRRARDRRVQECHQTVAQPAYAAGL